MEMRYISTLIIGCLCFLSYGQVVVEREQLSNISSFEGMWASNIILLPIGIYLTYLATTDSNLFGLKIYKSLKTYILKLVRNN